MAALDDGIVWSENLLSAKEAVNKLGLPCMVKVVNGCKHADFSSGHLLKLDFGIAIKKVAACFESTRPGSGSKDKATEIYVPLGYKGKVRVVRNDAGNKIYTSLKDLIDDFPRYVQVEESLASVEEGTNKTLGISSGSKIELDKAIGVTNLYCKYNGKSFVLTCKDKIKFRLLADDTTYTLQEVVDRLHLPQNVRFLDPEFKMVASSDLEGKCKDLCDTVKLNRVTSQEVIVGLLRPSEGPNCGPSSVSVRKKVQPTLALFPLQASAAVNDIKVKAAADKNDKTYKSTMAKLFPQTVDRILIQESFYVDLTSAVNIHIQHSNKWITVKPLPYKQERTPSPTDVPPPLPKGRQETKSPTQKEKKIDNKNTTNKQETTSVSPRSGSAKSGKSTPSSTSSFDEVALPIAPSTPSPPPPLVPTRDVTPKTTLSKDKPYRSGRPLPTPTDEAYEEPLKNKGNKGSVYVGPMPNKEPPKTSDYETLRTGGGASAEQYCTINDENIYDQLVLRDPDNTDKEKKELERQKKEEKKKSKGFNFFGGKKKKKDEKEGSKNSYDITPDTEEQSPFEMIPDMSNIGRDKAKPVGTVKPNTKGPPPKINKSKEFAKYSVVELVNCLNQCGLPDLAKLCEKERLDGVFLTSLSSELLSQEPFSLNSLHRAKLDQIKQGWRPTE